MQLLKKLQGEKIVIESSIRGAAEEELPRHVIIKSRIDDVE